MSTLYSNLKAFAYPEHVEAIRSGKAIAPVHVRIKPINACNHGCWFCAYRTDSLSLGSDMSLRDRIPEEKMTEIISDLISMKVRAVTFSGGGEPLLYKTIDSCITKLGEAGIRIGMLTNGSYLASRAADALASFGSWVRVSMDYWDEPSFLRSRKGKTGEYDKIFQNLEAFAARNSRCVLGASFIITQENAALIYEVCKRLKSAGVSHVKLSPCIVSNESSVTNEYHSHIAETVSDEIAHAVELNDEGFTAVNHYHQLSETFEKSYTSCPLLKLLTVIGADCGIYTCQDKAYTQSGFLGSVKERSFQEVWFSDEMQEKLMKFNPQESCTHHCVGNQKNEMLVQFASLDPGHLAFV